MRVLAWLSVAAYLFANTHTSSVFAALAKRPAAQTDGSEAPKAKRTCCSHCQKRQAKSTSTPTEPVKQSVIAPQNDHSSCPCCPASCPDSNPCALCAVAKIPVTLATGIDVHQVPPSEDSCFEPEAVHRAGFTGKLMRPPRS